MKAQPEHLELQEPLGLPVLIGSDGRPLVNASRTGLALLPGSFNPLHQGHWGLAEVAAALLKTPVAFELSVVNADKPPLAATELQRRVGQFVGRAAVWLTSAATFAAKAELFPQCAFIVGSDTAVRIVAPRFYGNAEEPMQAALAQIRSHGCRFLVACRRGSDEQLLRLRDIVLPAGFGDLFEEIPETTFRLDVSSSSLRQRTS